MSLIHRTTFGKRSGLAGERPKLADEPRIFAWLQDLAPDLADLSRERDERREAAATALAARLETCSVADLFDIMDLAIRAGGTISENGGFEACWSALHERPETEVLLIAKAWARDGDPQRRIAAIRALAREVDEDELPVQATKETLLALLSDSDPRVVWHAVCGIACLCHPTYYTALEAHGHILADHPDADVREAYRDYMGEGEDPRSSDEIALEALLETATVPEIFALALEKVAADDEYFAELCFEACHRRSEREVLLVARGLARDRDPARRAVAASALGRTHEDGMPVATASIDVVVALTADPEPSVVLAALAAFAQLTDAIPDARLAVRVAHCADHADAEVRLAYQQLVNSPLSAAGHRPAPLLRALRDEDLGVAHQACVQLAYFDDVSTPELCDALIAYCNHELAYFRIWAVAALARRGDPRAVAMIKRELDEAKKNDNLAGACDPFLQGIMVLPDPDFVPALEALHARLPGQMLLPEVISICRSAKRRFMPYDAIAGPGKGRSPWTS